MNVKNIFIFTLLSLQFVYADTTSIVLQNGLGGYNGCEDSYNFTEGIDVNYSTEEDLHIFSCIP